MIIQAASIFGAGLLTSLTPCIYPMIPITLGYLGSAAGQKNKKSIVVAFVMGQVLALTTLGVLAVTLGEVLGFSSELPSVQLITAAMLFVFAYYFWKGDLPSFLKNFGSTTKGPVKKRLSLVGAVSFGALSALLASTCASPILGGVLASVAGADSWLQGGFLMFLFSLGLSMTFLVLGLGMVSASQLPRSGAWLGHVHKISSALLFMAGGYYLFLGLKGW